MQRPAVLAGLAAAAFAAMSAVVVFFSRRKLQSDAGRLKSPPSGGEGAASSLFGDLTQNEFDAASAFARTSTALQSVDTDVQLKLYGLYKQATAGPLAESSEAGSLPPVYDIVGRKKYEAWASLGSLSAERAREDYVEYVSELVPDWQAMVADDEGVGTEAQGRTSEAMVGVVASNAMELTAAEQAMSGAQVVREVSDVAQEFLDAVCSGDADSVRDLIGQSADAAALVRACNAAGDTALHMAVDGEHEEVVAVLLLLKADVNATDGSNMTPLHVAALVENETLAQLLLSHGADPSAEDEDGEAPDLSFLGSQSV